eukprot:3908229-Rhodomonas_salina.1
MPRVRCQESGQAKGHDEGSRCVKRIRFSLIHAAKGQMSFRRLNRDFFHTPQQLAAPHSSTTRRSTLLLKSTLHYPGLTCTGAWPLPPAARSAPYHTRTAGRTPPHGRTCPRVGRGPGSRNRGTPGTRVSLPVGCWD